MLYNIDNGGDNMLPISIKERELIIFHKSNKETNENISKWTHVSISTITRIWSRYKATGSCQPKPQNSGRKPLVSDETMDKIIAKIKEVPDMTIVELIKEFELCISESALCRRLIKCGLTYKKRHSIQSPKSVKM